MATPKYGSLPFGEQIEFFRRKLNLPTTGWTDIYGAEHDWAFVVAGANRDEIVGDFRAAVEKAIAEGTTLAEFRKDFDRIVLAHGWEYNGGRNWRSRVIYENNLRSSYAAGRYEQLQAVKRMRPYWMYVHSDAVVHPRPLHESWHGLVLHADNPWWLTHFGPNGWGCQCTVRALDQRALQRRGKSGPDPTPEIVWEERTIGQRSALGPRTVRVPEGIDPGFEHIPGRSRFDSAMPPPLPGAPTPGVPTRDAPDSLPPARSVPAPSELALGEAIDQLLAQFGAQAQPQIFRDVIGERLVIGRDLFLDAAGALRSPIAASELPLLSVALRSPDEIWVRIESAAGLATVRRRYLVRVRVDGTDAVRLVVLERGKDGWTAAVLSDYEANDWRNGVRLYVRDGGE